MVKKIMAKTFLCVVLAALYLPILWLIVFSFTDTTSIASWRGFSFNAYIELFTGSNSDDILKAIINTLIIAVFASAISTVLGTLAAIGINSIKSKKVKFAYKQANQIPMVNSEIVTAVSLMLLFGMLRSFIVLEGEVQLINVILAHTTFCTPYVLLNVLPRLQKSDNKIYEAAMDLGCTPSQALWKVVIPDILPGIIMGFIMSVTLSIDDFVITQFTLDGGIYTLSTLIYSKASGKKPLPIEMRALSAIIFVIIAALLLYANKKSSSDQKKKITNTGTKKSPKRSKI